MAAVWWEAGIDVRKQAIQFLACVNSSHSSFRRSQPGTAEGTQHMLLSSCAWMIGLD